MLFNLDDINKNLLDPRNHTASYNGALTEVNLGRFNPAETAEKIILYPLKNFYYTEYVKVDNAYYVDKYLVNINTGGESLYGKVLEINGEQYYIPSADQFSQTAVIENASNVYGFQGQTTVPIAIKL